MKSLETKTRKVFHSIHRGHMKNKKGFLRVKNLLSCKNLKLPSIGKTAYVSGLSVCFGLGLGLALSLGLASHLSLTLLGF